MFCFPQRDTVYKYTKVSKRRFKKNQELLRARLSMQTATWMSVHILLLLLRQDDVLNTNSITLSSKKHIAPTVSSWMPSYPIHAVEGYSNCKVSDGWNLNRFLLGSTGLRSRAIDRVAVKGQQIRFPVAPESAIAVVYSGLPYNICLLPHQVVGPDYKTGGTPLPRLWVGPFPSPIL